MIEIIRAHQLNLMLMLCGACGILILLLFNTRFLSKRNKQIMILMEVIAFLLLWFDRLAYIYAGDSSETGFVMVRLSNFFVFFLTPTIVFAFNLYITDWLMVEGQLKKVPRRLKVVAYMAIAGMVMAVLAAFTDLYYYFAETNTYHRGSGFLLAYIIPVMGPILQYTVIKHYKRIFSRLIYLSLILYLFVPIVCGILQVFTYGISIVNMSMVAVSLSMYILLYLDLNNTVEHAHEIEIQHMQGEKKHMEKLFDQIAMSFVAAAEKKDEYMKGNSQQIAAYARQIAEFSGMDEEECKKVYYAALLHDVGIIGVPDNVIQNQEDPGKWDYEAMRKKPLIGEEILSSITEYPYLSLGAHYSHERYNGTGYPEGLKGEEIPEIARIIAVADAYVTMTSRKRYRGAKPDFIARETLVKGGGDVFDPVFANHMVKIIDSGAGRGTSAEEDRPETEFICYNYREYVTRGITVSDEEKKITFDCEFSEEKDRKFCAPSIILFDSFDGRVHSDEKSIEAYHYLEYGEVWFDKYSITTAAREIEEKIIEEGNGSGKNRKGLHRYEITAGRFEDHVRIVMKSEEYTKEVIVALPSLSKSAIIGLTGENCRVTNISIGSTDNILKDGDIRRIAAPISYIDHLEADLKNIQIDQTRSASTAGIRITGKHRIAFHAQILPSASLVWHCPYVLLFYSANGRVDGDDFREYNLIKLNGEDQGDEEYANNKFTMKKKADFPGWEEWKELGKKGTECVLYVEKKGDQVILKTDHLGISIEDVTTIKEEKPAVYLALTGDQVALTDIRID
ncbi:MAG: HD domain-containing protein [Lachnospiraceae bacterium]|nr:HD domain-containing protein [Lachnospiraceae bacterium]